MTATRISGESSPELREQMRAAVEHLWDGVDDVSPNLKTALRRVAHGSETVRRAA